MFKLEDYLSVQNHSGKAISKAIKATFLQTVKHLAIVLLTFSVLYSPVSKSEDIEIPKQDWSFDGPFGHFDKGQLQRGFFVFQQVCASCHQLSNVAFYHLEGLGYNELEIKAIAAEYEITDGPDDAGDSFFRQGIISDYLPDPFENEKQARASNGGAFPVNLSTIIKARSGGADYVAAILNGYEEAPAGLQVGDTQYYNKYFKGNLIAMPQQLSDDMLEYTDGTADTELQYAKDVSAFLAWASEPHMIERKQLGLVVILFLVFFLIIAVIYQKLIWRRLD